MKWTLRVLLASVCLACCCCGADSMPSCMPDDVTSCTHRHWCILDSSVTPIPHFNQHIAHAAQSLFPCWSWFFERNATDACGLVLNDGLHLHEGWITQLTDAMGCKVVYNVNTSSSGAPNEALFSPPRSKNGIPESPTNLNKISWFKEPNAAAALRDRILGRTNSTKNPGTLKVGFIQRQRSRVVTNFPEIQRLLHEQCHI